MRQSVCAADVQFFIALMVLPGSTPVLLCIGGLQALHSLRLRFSATGREHGQYDLTTRPAELIAVSMIRYRSATETVTDGRIQVDSGHCSCTPKLSAQVRSDGGATWRKRQRNWQRGQVEASMLMRGMERLAQMVLRRDNSRAAFQSSARTRMSARGDGLAAVRISTNCQTRHKHSHFQAHALYTLRALPVRFSATHDGCSSEGANSKQRDAGWLWNVLEWNDVFNSIVVSVDFGVERNAGNRADE